MKKTIYLILFLLMLPIIVIAQEIGKDAVVAPVKMNILYRGISNPIEIAVPGVTIDRVTATITNGTIKRVTNGWEVIPGEQTESAITVLVDNKKVSEKIFRLKNIPKPVVVFAGISDGQISKEKALKTEALEVKLIDFDWDLKFEIESFSLLYSDRLGDISEFSKGNKITDRMKEVMSRLTSGKFLVFKEIKALAPDGKIVELNPIVLAIE